MIHSTRAQERIKRDRCENHEPCHHDFFVFELHTQIARLDSTILIDPSRRVYGFEAQKGSQFRSLSLTASLFAQLFSRRQWPVLAASATSRRTRTETFGSPTPHVQRHGPQRAHSSTIQRTNMSPTPWTNTRFSL